MNRPPLRLPYGLSSFRDIRQEGLAYVDKTPVIEALERCGLRFPLFLRPRRFGKTLLTTMLMEYYDSALAEDFDKLFAGTCIHAHPTPLQGRFQVLRLDFSGIDAAQACRGFTEKLLLGMSGFFSRHPVPGYGEVLSTVHDTPSELFRAFCLKAAQRPDARLFVIIDEYDQSANGILASASCAASGQARRLESSPQGGFLEDFYAELRAQAACGLVSRVFITGVTPFSLDVVSAGFGLQQNVTDHPDFAAAAGFTEVELRRLTAETLAHPAAGMNEDDLVARMLDLYGGWRFSPKCSEPVLNASMCLHFLSALQDTGEEPSVLLDPSFSTDASRLRRILSLSDPGLARRIVDTVLSGREIMPHDGAPAHASLLDPSGRFEKAATFAVLSSMGFLTFAESGAGLCAPNKAILGQFFEHFFDAHFGAAPVFPIDALQELSPRLAAGDCTPLLELVCGTLREAAHTGRFIHASESMIRLLLKSALLTNPDYEAVIEDEPQCRGLSVVFLRPKREDRGLAAHLIAVKCFPKADDEGTNVGRAAEEASSSLERLADADPFRSVKNLRKTAAVFVGLELAAVKTA